MDAYRERVGEVRSGEEPGHLLEESGQEDVVVADVADDLAARLAQCLVTVPLAAAHALREVEEPDAIVGEERLDGSAGVALDAVADDEELELDSFLRQHAADRVRQDRGVPERGNQDRRVRHLARASGRSILLAGPTRGAIVPG